MRTLPTVCVALVALLRSCKADSAVLTKPVGDEEATPAVLSAQLALTKVQLPLCTGVNDALPVTFSHPLADDPLTESFAVTVGNDTVEPTCATLAPANEANERQTVLLLGKFQTDTQEPTQVGIRGLSFTVNGSRVALAKDDSFSVDLEGPAATVPVTRNQTLVDYAILDLTADDNTADDDEDGCAAMFPASTYAVRLIFSSGVRDIDAMGEVVPLGADASAERARELFRLLSAAGEPSADTIIGQADADGDNIADVCVEGAGAQRDAAVLIVACEDGAAVVAPDGAPCTTPIEVDLDGTRSTLTGSAPAPAPAPASPEASASPRVQSPPDSSATPALLLPDLARVAALAAPLLLLM